jgi:hypothetical protein
MIINHPRALLTFGYSAVAISLASCSSDPASNVEKAGQAQEEGSEEHGSGCRDRIVDAYIEFTVSDESTQSVAAADDVTEELFGDWLEVIHTRAGESTHGGTRAERRSPGSLRVQVVACEDHTGAVFVRPRAVSINRRWPVTVEITNLGSDKRPDAALVMTKGGSPFSNKPPPAIAQTPVIEEGESSTFVLAPGCNGNQTDFLVNFGVGFFVPGEGKSHLDVAPNHAVRSGEVQRSTPFRIYREQSINGSLRKNNPIGTTYRYPPVERTMD